MKFKGDIIITDPCYIMKEMKEVGSFPEEKDFFQFKEPSEYPDAEYKKGYDDDLDLDFLKKMGIPLSLFATSEMYFSDKKRYEEAIEKYKEDNLDDWEKSDYGVDLAGFGFTTYITESTGCGDWSCETINTDNNKQIGRFCADAGMVGVYLLEEVLKYNPEFDYHLDKPHTTTLIKNFDGEIDVHWSGGSPYIYGKGNINFKTKQ